MNDSDNIERLKHFSVQAPVRLIDEFTEMCKAKKTDRSKEIRSLMRQALARWDEEIGA